MPLSYSEAIKHDLNRMKFITEVEKKAVKKKPKKVGIKPAYGTLLAKRNVNLAVREAALRLAQIVITYNKITTGETKKYVVAPYSYRFRRLKVGVRKLLFAWDMEEKRIKGFVLKNIYRVAITDRTFRPKWVVEF